MHLSSLTLRGFKSFASATTLRLEPGITCVVGPNGSGKSNVVDAIAWVLGEQGARTLRGGSMADVIFAGTATRAPLGRAEVVLTFDNSDGLLGEGTAEVSVTRTMFRAGGSEYAINGRACRLLDVQELLGDAGIGRELHVVVGQGRVDAVLQATPEERRSFVEEAAGVLKHRKRKEKALRKLAAMDGNLVRLADLTAEIARQLKPLGRQADTARRARRIAADARDARLRLLADDVSTVRAGLGGHDGPGPAAQRLADVAERLHAAQVAASRAQAEESRVRPRAYAWSEQLGRARTVNDRLRGIARLADERARLLAEPVAGPGADLDELAAVLARAEAEAADLGAQVGAAHAALEAAGTVRQQAEGRHEAAERAAREHAAERARRSEAVVRLRGQVATLRGRVESADAEAERLARTLAEAEQRRAEAAARFDGLRREGAGTPVDGGAEAATEEDPAAAAVAAHEQALAAHTVAADAQREAEQRERVAERERAALLARRDALASTTVPVDATAEVLEGGSGVLGLLSSMLRVEPGHEHALAAALGPDADAVAMTSLDEAATAVERLHDRDGGRVAIVVPSAAPHAADRPLPGLGALDGVRGTDGARPAAELVLGSTAVAAWARHRLARTVVVDDLVGGRALLERLERDQDAEAGSVVVVTLLGDVLSVDGLRGGSGAAPSLIERQAVLDEAERELVAAEAVLATAGADAAAAREATAAAKDRLDAAEADRSALDARMSALAQQLGAVSAQMRAAADEADRARAQAEQVAVRRAGFGAELDQAEAALAAASAGDDDADSQSGADEDRDVDGDEDGYGRVDVQALADAARAARQAETEARLSARTAEERARSAGERAQASVAALGRARQEHQAAAERQAARARAAAEAGEVLTDAAHAVEAAGRVLERVQAGEAAARREREAVQARARDAAAAVQALGAEHSRLVEASHAEELARTEQRLRLEQLVETAHDEHGLDADALVAQYGPAVPVPVEREGADGEVDTDHEPYDRARQQRRLRTAERGLAELGTVNPLAMEEYTALEERHRFLLQQQQDLSSSKKDLLGIIRDVDARVEEVVSAAYTDTAREFEQIIPRLFPGGVGRLVLTEPDDILSTGIEVEARPAGKTVKRMSLLSGGERTLVALAFLVALFKARPSPFYVLDEIEAALDDANLGRLLVLMEELRASSQLIVVTHQKRTMEAADALYGVTMRGDGVTTVVSQRLREVG